MSSLPSSSPAAHTMFDAHSTQSTIASSSTMTLTVSKNGAFLVGRNLVEHSCLPRPASAKTQPSTTEISIRCEGMPVLPFIELAKESESFHRKLILLVPFMCCGAQKFSLPAIVWLSPTAREQRITKGWQWWSKFPQQSRRGWNTWSTFSLSFWRIHHCGRIRMCSLET